MKGVWPAVLLAWVAGFVDALGYLVLSHVFTAHMSGNSAALGAHLGQGNWHETLLRGLAVPPFLAGVALGVLVEELGERGRAGARLAPAFALELLCLASFVAAEHLAPTKPVRPGTAIFVFLVSVLAAAMGLQSATLRRAGGTRVRTTYISGMLTNMAENFVYYLLQARRRRSGWAGENPGSQKPFGRLALTFGLIFISFLVGAACGGFGESAWGSAALLAPMAGLAALIAQEWLVARVFAKENSKTV